MENGKRKRGKVPAKCDIFSFSVLIDKDVYEIEMLNALESRLISFSVGIIRLTERLIYTEASKVLRSQLLRSATSVALNYAEAQNAQSKKEFIYKVSVAYKELRETKVNLLIINEAELFRDRTQLEKLLIESNELAAIFTTILKTAKKNLHSQNPDGRLTKP
jgi:four helix bundle protein